MSTHTLLSLSTSSADDIFPSSLRKLPKLIVFDLDMCIWSPEMYELDEIPTAKGIVQGKIIDGEGVSVVRSGNELIRIFPDAMVVLADIYRGKYGDMRIAAASSADTPRAVQIGRAAMGLLEVLPGVNLREVFGRGWAEGFEGNMQIGRSAPLSSNKAETHFPLIKQSTGINYEDMVFFDDCSWGDHCSNVARLCPGVVTQRTPRGLRKSEWEAALNAYHLREMKKINVNN